MLQDRIYTASQHYRIVYIPHLNFHSTKEVAFELPQLRSSTYQVSGLSESCARRSGIASVDERTKKQYKFSDTEEKYPHGKA